MAQKSARYAMELATAPVYLLRVDDVGDGVRTLGRPRVENFGYMRIGHRTCIRSAHVPVELCTAPGGRLFVGCDTTLRDGSSIGATASIEIGSRVYIGPYAMIVDTDFHDPHNRHIRPAPSPVVIDDDVWIGAKACIMPGVHVGRGAIVGSGAVVTHDVPPFSVVAGVPAQVVKTLDTSRARVVQEIVK